MSDALLNAAQLQAAQATVPDAKAAKNMAKVEEAAREFEAVFIAEMMKPMFENISTDGMFGGGQAEEIFRGMLVQEYGKQLAAQGTIGISDHVKEELLRIQASSNQGVNDENL
jgi:flagellar protein FlgJ